MAPIPEVDDTSNIETITTKFLILLSHVASSASTKALSKAIEGHLPDSSKPGVEEIPSSPPDPLEKHSGGVFHSHSPWNKPVFIILGVLAAIILVCTMILFYNSRRRTADKQREEGVCGGKDGAVGTDTPTVG